MLPLDGIVVVSLEQAVAAPFATRQLADLGARVIKIERPEGDFARGYDRTVHGQASYFVWLNRSKESVVLDLKSPGGRTALRRLLARADVFVQNLAPGAVDRLGFAVEQLRADRPELITCSISGYGNGGPWRDRKAYDALIQCETGLLSITGTPDTPVKVGISVADIAAGVYAYSGILTALYHRERTGEGCALEVSLFDALAEWMSQPALMAQYTGTDPRRFGAHHTVIAPYGPYPVADGTVQLAVQNEREWRRFAFEVLEAPALADDPRFDSNSDRVAHRADLDQELARWMSRFTVTEITARLDRAGIANATVNTVTDFLDHVQLTARNRWTNVATPAGEVRTLLPPVTSEQIDVRVDPVPALGQHTRTVLAEFEFTDDEIAQMSTDEVAR
ncbi:CaiB/BaiF CoA transferase family protein [Micromonospora sp. NPDC001898]|uniref:CaiB/BaiF CoA transferase family protein n=1 Tax=Micromonospora sp. NPDC001898 TaxID=3364221 RepID=UPI00367536EE